MKSFNSSRKVFLSVLVSILPLFSGTASAWGPHRIITQKALSALPKVESGFSSEASQNFIVVASIFPDQMGDAYKNLKGLGSFQVVPFVSADGVTYRNDWKPKGPVVSTHLYYSVPKRDYEEYFERTIRAVESENGKIAALKVGVMCHLVEDATCPQHGELQYTKCYKRHSSENWTPANELDLTGYKPKVIGKTKSEAIKNFTNWIENYYNIVGEISAEMLPLLQVEDAKLDKAKISALNMKCAKISAEATADLIYTLRQFENTAKGGEIYGTVKAPNMSIFNDQLAHLVLLKEDGSPSLYDTFTSSAKDSSQCWTGAYKFKNIPAGKYKILALRAGALKAESKVFQVEIGKKINVDFELKTRHAGNIINDISVPSHYYGATIFPYAVEGKYKMGVKIDSSKSKNWTPTFMKIEGKFYWSPSVYKHEKIKMQNGSEIEVEVEPNYKSISLNIGNPKNAPKIIEDIWVVPLSK